MLVGLPLAEACAGAAPAPGESALAAGRGQLGGGGWAGSLLKIRPVLHRCLDVPLNRCPGEGSGESGGPRLLQTARLARWNRIYSDSDEVNQGQRKHPHRPHRKPWGSGAAVACRKEGNLAGRSFLDAGLWRRPASRLPWPSSCRQHARQRTSPEGDGERRRAAGRQRLDLGQSASNSAPPISKAQAAANDTVICLDVFIHYPQEPPSRWCATWPRWPMRPGCLAASPLHPLLAALKCRSALPGPSKTPRLHLRGRRIVAAAANGKDPALNAQLNHAPFSSSR